MMLGDDYEEIINQLDETKKFFKQYSNPLSALEKPKPQQKRRSTNGSQDEKKKEAVVGTQPGLVLRSQESLLREASCHSDNNSVDKGVSNRPSKKQTVKGTGLSRKSSIRRLRKSTKAF